MAPRRKDLTQQSIWDETLLAPVLTQIKLRLKLWRHLINSFAITPTNYHNKYKSLDELPYDEWNFPKIPVEKIKAEFKLFTTTISERNESARGDTTKLLVRLQDGHEVETVIMRHKGHATVCISSQIGCQMGCRFCATGTMGIIGDLSSGEIIEQLIYANSITPIRNVVFMGMGEPLNNYENVKRAVNFMVDNRLFALSPRHVTVSTVGVLKNMYRLSDELPFVNLAFSLHAPNQEVRLQIVPAAKAHPLEKLMEAIDYHIQKNNEYHDANSKSLNKKPFKKPKKSSPSSSAKNNNSSPAQAAATPAAAPTTTEEDGNGVTTAEEEEEDSPEEDLAVSGKKKILKITGVMIEYILIKDINDKDIHAHELAQLLAPRKKYVLLNLIPYNPTEVAEDYFPPDPAQVESFQKICMSSPYEIHTRVRQEKGQDIAGACGQLAVVKGKQNQKEKNNNNNSKENSQNGSTTELEDLGKKSTAKTVTFSSSAKGCSSSNGGSCKGGSCAGSATTASVLATQKEDAEIKKRAELCFLLNLSVPVFLFTSSLVADFLSKHT